jgi:O-antigen/teichoic acid export membrane protein
MRSGSPPSPAGRGIWSLADQGVVSLGSFLTHIILGRYLPLAEYGVFALCLGFLIFLNALHGSLISYPLSLKGSVSAPGRLRRHTSGALVLTLVMSVLAAPALAGVAWVLGRLDVAVWLIVAMVFWQLQETVRRALMAHLRHREAVWGDGVSYIGQAAAMLVLALTGALTLPAAFAALAATSALALMMQAWKVGLARVKLRQVLPMARQYLGMGRWLLCTNFLSLITMHATPWTLAVFHGTAQVAAFQAMVNVLGMSNPVIFSIANLIVPTVSRERQRRGAAAARRVAMQYVLQGAMVLTPYFLLVMLAPWGALRLFYGAESPYLDLAAHLRVFVLVFALAFAVQMMAAMLNGLGRSQGTFAAQAASAATNVMVTLPLAALFGLSGAIWGGLVPLVVAGGVSLHFLRQAVAPPETLTEGKAAFQG